MAAVVGYPIKVVEKEMSRGDNSLQMRVIRRRLVVRKVSSSFGWFGVVDVSCDTESLAMTRTQSLHTAKSIPVVDIRPPEANSASRMINGHGTDVEAALEAAEFRNRARKML